MNINIFDEVKEDNIKPKIVKEDHQEENKQLFDNLKKLQDLLKKETNLVNQEKLKTEIRNIKSTLTKLNSWLIERTLNRYNIFDLDSRQNAYIAIDKIYDMYDPNKGKFEDFVNNYLITIVKRLTYQQEPIDIAVHLKEKAYKVLKAIDDLSRSTGKEPSYIEVAKYLNEDENLIKRVMYAIEIGELTYYGLANDPLLDEEIIDDYTTSIDEDISRETLKEVINEVIEELTPEQRETIIYRFGLDGGGIRTIDEIAAMANVNRVTIHKREVAALKILNRKSSLRKINPNK